MKRKLTYHIILACNERNEYKCRLFPKTRLSAKLAGTRTTSTLKSLYITLFI